MATSYYTLSLQYNEDSICIPTLKEEILMLAIKEPQGHLVREITWIMVRNYFQLSGSHSNTLATSESKVSARKSQEWIKNGEN